MFEDSISVSTEPFAVRADWSGGHTESVRVGKHEAGAPPLVVTQYVMAIVDNKAVSYVGVEVSDFEIVDMTVSRTRIGSVRISRLENLNTVHPRPRKNSSFF